MSVYTRNIKDDSWTISADSWIARLQATKAPVNGQVAVVAQVSKPQVPNSQVPGSRIASLRNIDERDAEGIPTPDPLDFVRTRYLYLRHIGVKNNPEEIFDVTLDDGDVITVSSWENEKDSGYDRWSKHVVSARQLSNAEVAARRNRNELCVIKEVSEVEDIKKNPELKDFFDRLDSE
jgi:hypothetical protein